MPLIDQTSRVPDLIDEGFASEIICTHGTKAVLLHMLRDAILFSDRTDQKALGCTTTRSLLKNQKIRP